MRPEFPLISVYKKLGLEIIKSETELRNVKTASFISQNPDEKELYDRHGKRWTFKYVNDKIINDFKTRLLAKTFYNPAVTVDLAWKVIADYNITELKNAIILCADKDDDVITQFEEADIIKSKIVKCETFDDILITLNKYVFEVDEEALWNERENGTEK